MEPLYDVCFAAQLLDGQELQSVRDRIQKLFKANPATLEKLFSGKTQVLKRGCDKATALKYKKAMEAAGAKPMIRAGEVTTDPGASEPTTAEQKLDLAPVGADMLRPEEREVPARTNVDVSHLDLAVAGSTLGEPAPETQSAPDTNHLSMGEVGEDIPNLPDTAPGITPDTSEITLAPEGNDFSDCAPPNDVNPDPDLSAIELAPTGADVLDKQYKKKEEASAPDTSHLSLDP